MHGIPGLPLVGKGRGMGDWGGGAIPLLPQKLACPPHVPPTVLTQKCQFCNFHAVFGHFVQIVLRTSRHIRETLNTVVTSGLMSLVVAWNCWISYKNKYAALSVLHLPPLWNPWLMDKM